MVPQFYSNFVLCHHLHYSRSATRAVKMPFHLADKLDYAVLAGKEGIVCGAKDVRSRGILGAALADDDLADHDFLAVLKLDAEPFGNGIAS